MIVSILATRAFTGKKGSGKIAFYIEVTYVGIVHFQGWTRTEKFKSKRELRNLNTAIYTDVQLRTTLVEGPLAEFEVRWGELGWGRAGTNWLKRTIWMVPGKAPKGPQILSTDLLSLPFVSIICWLIWYCQKRVGLKWSFLLVSVL